MSAYGNVTTIPCYRRHTNRPQHPVPIYICPSLSAEEITAVAITTTGPGKMDEVITPPEVDEVMGDTEDDNDQDCGPSLEDMMS